MKPEEFSKPKHNQPKVVFPYVNVHGYLLSNKPHASKLLRYVGIRNPFELLGRCMDGESTYGSRSDLLEIFRQPSERK